MTEVQTVQLPHAALIRSSSYAIGKGSRVTQYSNVTGGAPGSLSR